MKRTFLSAVLVLAACGEPVIEQPAVLAGETPFAYPVELWDRSIEGQTVLLLHVTEEGAVDSVLVDRSSGHAAFDSAAVVGAFELRFAPGTRDGRNAAMWARLPVRFRRDGAGTDGIAGGGT